MIIIIHANNPVIPVVVLDSIPAASLRGLSKNPEAAWQDLHMGNSRLLATEYGLGSRGCKPSDMRDQMHTGVANSPFTPVLSGSMCTSFTLPSSTNSAYRLLRGWPKIAVASNDRSRALVKVACGSARNRI